jgi:uncharacterized cupin superfamily protein
MKKIDAANLPVQSGSGYPSPLDQPCAGRQRTRLGDAAGLTQFGVNLLRLPAGAWSSQRHWHSVEDEFTYVLEGEVVLVTDEGEEVLRAGDCAGFRAGDANGHHFQNRSDADVVLLDIGSRRPEADAVDYPGLDLILAAGDRMYRHRDGSPY